MKRCLLCGTAVSATSEQTVTAVVRGKKHIAHAHEACLAKARKGPKAKRPGKR